MPHGSPLGHRAPVLWLVLPLATGIALAHASPWAVPKSIVLPLIGLATVAAVGCLLADLPPRRTLTLTVLLGLLVGMLHHDVQRQRLPDWDRLPQREVSLDVHVDRVFAHANPDWPLSFIGTIVGADSHLADLTGQALHVRARRRDATDTARRDEVLTVLGQLEPLPRRGGRVDDFEDYLIDRGLNFRLVRGRVLAHRFAPSAYARWRDDLKLRASAVLGAGLARRPDLAGALQAMLLGQREALSASAQALFVQSGTMHLFAISGLHIGIIAGVLYGGLRLLRLPRWAALLAGALWLAFYVDLIGRTPSAVRAWLMVICVQASLVLRAPGNPLAGLAVSALLVLLIDPLQLFSTGLQMSYGIVAALLLYGLPLGQILAERWRPWRHLPHSSLRPWQQRWLAMWPGCLEALAMSWSASVVGLISGVAFFGWFTPLALPANLVLIPLAGLAITGGFLAMVLGLVGADWLALVFNHGAALVLAGMQQVLACGTAATGGATPAQFITAWWGEAGLLLALGTMLVGYAQGWTGRWGRWWYPPAVTAVVLVTGMRFG